MLLITTFVELRVVTERIGKQVHAVPMPRCNVALISRFQNGMVMTCHGRSMACVNQTGPYCVHRMEKTQSKPLAAPNSRGMAWAWERHGMGELTLIVPSYQYR
jgi:hypothetical protein